MSSHTLNRKKKFQNITNSGLEITIHRPGFIVTITETEKLSQLWTDN
jgi:hypothetical protein